MIQLEELTSSPCIILPDLTRNLIRNPSLTTILRHSRTPFPNLICDWTHTHQKSFGLIKQTLSADLAVRPLDYESTETRFLVTDASLIGTGA